MVHAAIFFAMVDCRLFNQPYLGKGLSSYFPPFQANNPARSSANDNFFHACPVLTRSPRVCPKTCSSRLVEFSQRLQRFIVRNNPISHKRGGYTFSGRVLVMVGRFTVSSTKEITISLVFHQRYSRMSFARLQPSSVNSKPSSVHVCILSSACSLAQGKFMTTGISAYQFWPEIDPKIVAQLL